MTKSICVNCRGEFEPDEDRCSPTEDFFGGANLADGEVLRGTISYAVNGVPASLCDACSRVFLVEMAKTVLRIDQETD